MVLVYLLLHLKDLYQISLHEQRLRIQKSALRLTANLVTGLVACSQARGTSTR